MNEGHSLLMNKGLAQSLLLCVANPPFLNVHLFSTKPARKQSMDRWIKLFIINVLQCVYWCSPIHHKILRVTCLCRGAAEMRARWGSDLTRLVFSQETLGGRQRASILPGTSYKSLIWPALSLLKREWRLSPLPWNSTGSVSAAEHPAVNGADRCHSNQCSHSHSRQRPSRGSPRRSAIIP